MNIKNNCDFCKYKSLGNSCSVEQITNAYTTNDCPKFVIGKCFSCAINKQEDKSACIRDLFPSGCGNYKNEE